MYILASMWFTKLIKQFFFWIDKIVFNFISTIYDLMITIARTSPLSQSDILDMAGRVYKLLAVFMIFKVTLSLITYVVNPDDFTDKTKGISKLGTNIIISLSLLILTPYIFNYAYQFQTIILEDNTLATLIFGDNTEKQSFFNSAGDDMAYLTFSAFLTPNLSLGDLWQCTNLLENGKLNSACETALREENKDNKDNFSKTTLENYKVAVENNSLGMLLRQDLVTATNKDNSEFIMDYKFIFSTIVGVIVILLLLSFCIDVAVRSIKLAFLQLIAPVPILSYVDPKSGKDGMFKKWYQMCFKTYLSLFVRLLALYFSVYIISMVADHGLVDIIDGSTQTNGIVKIFIIIGALMFAKQFPEILKGLGIKLDGGSKFTLNPLKKMEEGALGGKRITGAARGFAVGAAGALSGAGAGRAFSGAFRGFTGGKGWKETGKAEAEMNRKMRQAKLDGSTFRGRMGAKFAGTLGLPTAADADKQTLEGYDAKIAQVDQQMEPLKTKQKVLKEISDAKGTVLKRAEQKLIVEEANGSFKDLQSDIRAKQARVDYLKNTGASADQIKRAEDELSDASIKNKKAYVDRNLAAAEARKKGETTFTYKQADGTLKTVNTADFKIDTAITDIQENIAHAVNTKEIVEINTERTGDGYTADEEKLREVTSFLDIASVSDIASDESRLLEVGDEHTSARSKAGTTRKVKGKSVRELTSEKEGYQQSKRDLQTSKSYKSHKADESIK